MTRVSHGSWSLIPSKLRHVTGHHCQSTVISVVVLSLPTRSQFTITFKSSGPALRAALSTGIRQNDSNSIGNVCSLLHVYAFTSCFRRRSRPISNRRCTSFVMGLCVNSGKCTCPQNRRCTLFSTGNSVASSKRTCPQNSRCSSFSSGNSVISRRNTRSITESSTNQTW